MPRSATAPPGRDEPPAVSGSLTRSSPQLDRGAGRGVGAPSGSLTRSSPQLDRGAGGGVGGPTGGPTRARPRRERLVGGGVVALIRCAAVSLTRLGWPL